MFQRLQTYPSDKKLNIKYQNPSTQKRSNWVKCCFQNQSAKTQMLVITLNFDFLKEI